MLRTLGLILILCQCFMVNAEQQGFEVRSMHLDLPPGYTEPPQDQPAVPLDDIRTQIIQLLQTTYKNYEIVVHVTDQSVIISGTVNSAHDKERIEKDILNITGVKKVDNQLKIAE